MSDFSHRTYRHEITRQYDGMVFKIEGRPKLAGSMTSGQVYVQIEGKDEYGDDLYSDLSFTDYHGGREELVELIATLQLAHDVTFGEDLNRDKDRAIQLSLKGTQVMQAADLARLDAYTRTFPKMEEAMKEHRDSLKTIKESARRITDLATVMVAKNPDKETMGILASAICVTEYELRDADLEPIYVDALLRETT